jgi:hypothetical protein
MPLNDGSRLHQDHRIEATRPYPVQPDPEEAVHTKEPGTAWTLAMQDCELVAERNDFELQFHAAAKPASEPGEDDRMYPSMPTLRPGNSNR